MDAFLIFSSLKCNTLRPRLTELFDQRSRFSFGAWKPVKKFFERLTAIILTLKMFISYIHP